MPLWPGPDSRILWPDVDLRSGVVPSIKMRLGERWPILKHRRPGIEGHQMSISIKRTKPSVIEIEWPTLCRGFFESFTGYAFPCAAFCKPRISGHLTDPASLVIGPWRQTRARGPVCSRCGRLSLVSNVDLCLLDFGLRRFSCKRHSLCTEVRFLVLPTHASRCCPDVHAL